VHRPGGPLRLPPLIAVTHSGFLRLPAFRDSLRACARLLIDAGADVNQTVGSRWPPASPARPSKEHRLSALYGAAGQHHDVQITQWLLAAGANPDDGESLYHSLESTECLRLLLEAGADVSGTNAMYRVLDLDNIEALRLLLAHGGDPNEPAGEAMGTPCGTPLLWAIRRRRSLAHVQALLAAGADAAATTRDGISTHVLALRFGLTEVAALLARALGHTEGESGLPVQERFVAACARGDEAAARHLLAAHPGLMGELTTAQLHMLPELASQGCGDAVRLMVALGWPIDVTSGDWQASALNQAVFRGDAPLAAFLLAHGAVWTEQHGYGDNARGTLSWASCNEPVPGGDWLGCAKALVLHGMPGAQPDPQDAHTVITDGRRMRFSDEVSSYLLEVGTSLNDPVDAAR
jgi:ankyrin repeat protein